MAWPLDLNVRQVHCRLTTVDNNGRCSDRSLLRMLGWQPGWRLEFAARPTGILVSADAHGPYATTKQGHLRFPAAVRHQCGLETGDRILLSAIPGRQILIACTVAVLEAILRAHWALDESKHP